MKYQKARYQVKAIMRLIIKHPLRILNTNQNQIQVHKQGIHTLLTNLIPIFPLRDHVLKVSHDRTQLHLYVFQHVREVVCQELLFECQNFSIHFALEVNPFFSLQKCVYTIAGVYDKVDHSPYFLEE